MYYLDDYEWRYFIFAPKDFAQTLACPFREFAGIYLSAATHDCKGDYFWWTFLSTVSNVPHAEEAQLSRYLSEQLPLQCQRLELCLLPLLGLQAFVTASWRLPVQWTGCFAAGRAPKVQHALYFGLEAAESCGLRNCALFESPCQSAEQKALQSLMYTLSRFETYVSQNP